jgi:hypothetical protein
MPTSTLRILIAIVLIAHGIGHGLGVLPPLGVRLTKTHSARSWLFSRLLGDTGARIISGAIWLLAMVAFIAAGLGLLAWLVPQNLWQPLAIGGAALSLVGLLLFWNAFPTPFPNNVAIIAVNVAILVSLLWLRWPPSIVSG